MPKNFSEEEHRILNLFAKNKTFDLSYSFATGISNPAFSNPRSRPPQPLNNDKIL